MAVIEVSASSFVAIQSGAASRDRVGIAGNTVTPSHSVTVNAKIESLSSTVAIHHTVGLKRVINLGVVNSVTPTQSCHPRTLIVSAVSNVGVNGRATIAKAFGSHSTLLPTSLASAVNTKGAKSKITITHTVTVKCVRNLSVESSVVIVSQVNVYKPNSLFLNPSLTLPVYVAVDKSVTFTFGSTILTLPKPDMNNADKFDFNRINRRSRGNTLIVYRDPTWPKTRTLSLSFSWIKENKLYEILSFLDLTLGREVFYIDHHGVQWKGIIMTPAAQLTQESSANIGLVLEFQGEKT